MPKKTKARVGAKRKGARRAPLARVDVNSSAIDADEPDEPEDERVGGSSDGDAPARTAHDGGNGAGTREANALARELGESVDDTSGAAPVDVPAQATACGGHVGDRARWGEAHGLRTRARAARRARTCQAMIVRTHARARTDLAGPDDPRSAGCASPRSGMDSRIRLATRGTLCTRGAFCDSSVS